MVTRIIEDVADMDKNIARMIVAGDTSMAELFIAARRGVISLVAVEKGAMPPMGWLNDWTPPVQLVLYDDNPVENGPDGWDGLAELIAWAEVGLIAVSPTIKACRAAVTATVRMGRMMMVVTRPDRVDAWSAILTAGNLEFVVFHPFAWPRQ